MAVYKVEGDALTGAGPYTIDVSLRYQAVPVNLIAAIMGVGFDYGMSPREVADRVVDGGEVIWTRTATVELGR
jgi:hypothetical protein